MPMNEMALPVALMVITVLAEALWLLRKGRQTEYNWSDVAFNLNSGHIVLWLFRGLEVAIYAWVVTHASFGWVSNWGLVWQSLFAIIAWDFCFYWLHRLHHTIPLFWAVHVVHHQGRFFNLSLGVRNSWYSSLTSIPFFLILAVLGVPLSLFITVSLIHYSVQLFNHNAVTPRSAWMDAIFVTPHHHRVHHGRDKPYINKNFGGTFIIWDKVFGTFERERQDVPLRYGIKGDIGHDNPLIASNLPLLRWLGLPKKAKKQATSLPTPLPTSLGLPVTHLLAATVASYSLVLIFIVYQGSLGFKLESLWQLLLACGVVGVGAASGGSRWGLVAWFFASLGLMGLFLYVFWSTQPLFIILACSVVLQAGLMLLLTWRRFAPPSQGEAV
ncbi:MULTISPECIES: sterol desaturase family protein [unclassified Acinetobacter]|uniref:sterol desaturase family protein n=1 Tax=unclassified Acinetobacter TaxID=196816 RepID=UPI0035BB273B